jgi:hypothetical protein
MRGTNRVQTSEKEEKRRVSNTQNIILSGLFIPESPDLDPVHRQPPPLFESSLSPEKNAKRLKYDSYQSVIDSTQH